jgi:surface antigen
MHVTSGGGGQQTPEAVGGKGGAGCALDGGGYCTGQCVDFVWTKRPELSHLGNATSWLGGAQGRKIPTGNTPVIGAVAWWSGVNLTYADSSAGHVAYVVGVGNGTVTFEEMNGPAGPFQVDRQTFKLNSYYAPQGYIYGGPAGNGSGSTTVGEPSGLPNGGSVRGTFSADINGDGKADLVAVDEKATFVMLSTGAGFSAPAAWSTTPFYGSHGTFTGDVNGDGKADLIAVNEGNTYVMLSTGSGFSAPQLWSGTRFYGSKATLAGDVTGDGKTDLIAVDENGTFVMPSTGSSFLAPQGWSSIPFYGS